MKIYLELQEIAEGEPSPDYFRIDVTGYTQADYYQQLQNLRDQATQYAHYEIRKHQCNHDTGQSCMSELIEAA